MTGYVTARRFRLLRPFVWFARTGIWLFVLAYFLVALAIVGVRHLVLPKVPEYREQIEAYATRALGERVTISSIEAGWQGLHPTLAVTDLRVYDREGRVALALPGVRAQISWRSLAFLDLRFHSLVFEKPSLAIRRTAAGRLRIAGIEVKDEPAGDQALGDWVLRQGEIVIDRGRLLWIDEMRGAPVLALDDVAFRLVNRLGGIHRVALRAVPPPDLASAIELRGDLRGASLERLEDWHGRAYARLESTDLAGWKPWVDYPIEVKSGRGGLQAWIEIEGRKIVDAELDLALAGVVARLDRTGPPLDLRRLEGRIGIRELRPGTGFFGLRGEPTRGFTAFVDDIVLVPVRGRPFEPFDLSLRYETPPAGPPRGELRADRLDVAAVTEIAEGLPLPTAVREFLVRARPRGGVSNIVARWTGDIEAPASYSATLAFRDFALKPAGNLPGVTPLAGTLQMSDRGGAIVVSGQDVRLEYPVPARGDAGLELGALDLRAGWTFPERDGIRTVEVEIENLVASSRDIAFQGRGRWRPLPASLGFVEFDLQVPRFEVAALHRYLPFVDVQFQAWLRRTLQVGSGTDGRIQMRGDLARFPFAERSDGRFEVRARVAGVRFQYDPGWPPIESASGDFSMDGRSIAINVARATTAGLQLSNLRARVPDYYDIDATLEIDGGADGATADALRFLQTTPLRDSAGRATASMSAEGRGRLALTLGVPLWQARETRVAGSYLFNANRFVFDPDQPPLSQLSGRLEFTERGVSARGLAAQFLGGSTTIAIGQREDRVYVVNAQGTAAVAPLVAAYPVPIAGQMQGQAPYRAVATLAPAGIELVVDSTLQGLALDLPAPLGKVAQDSVPLRLERVIDVDRANGRNALTVALGRVATIDARFRAEPGRGAMLDRVALTIGDTKVALPVARGINVAIDLPTFDIERLLGGLVAALPGGAVAPGGGGSATPPVAALSLRGREVSAFGRRLNEVSVRATPRERDAWSASIAAREMVGDLEWRPDAAGPGRVVARLKHLVVPESTAAAASGAGAQAKELPGLDVLAESFTVGGKALGRLELVAANEARTWRIERLVLTAPEGTISAQGSWRPRRGEERTEVSLALETKDAGKYLARLGQPDLVAGGQAKLEGTIGWSGPPYAIDYPSMTGNLSFHADQGRFLRAQPGVARLLGVLSLQSLPRRITLDFRDVFSDGFTFDQINANATITRGGILSTQDFRMTGPQAGVLITGRVDLEHETQDLRVRVVPIVGDSIAAVAALALLNPVVGLGTLIAQRLLKDPLGQVLAHEYTVSGNWAEPKVDRVLNVDRAPAPSQ